MQAGQELLQLQSGWASQRRAHAAQWQAALLGYWLCRAGSAHQAKLLDALIQQELEHAAAQGGSRGCGKMGGVGNCCSGAALLPPIAFHTFSSTRMPQPTAAHHSPASPHMVRMLAVPVKLASPDTSTLAPYLCRTRTVKLRCALPMSSALYSHCEDGQEGAGGKGA